MEFNLAAKFALLCDLNTFSSYFQEKNIYQLKIGINQAGQATCLMPFILSQS